MMREPAEEEYKKTIQHIEEILSDERLLEQWVERVMRGWRKRRSHARF